MQGEHRAQPSAGSVLDHNAKLLRIMIPGLKEETVREENRSTICAAIRGIEADLPKLHDELRAVLAKRKVLCFSEVPDNLLMWAHYAEYHTGAVIEFSYIEEGKYASAWGAARPVRYTAEMPRTRGRRGAGAEIVRARKPLNTRAFSKFRVRQGRRLGV